jgi:hypothetical protein
VLVHLRGHIPATPTPPGEDPIIRSINGIQENLRLHSEGSIDGMTYNINIIANIVSAISGLRSRIMRAVSQRSGHRRHGLETQLTSIQKATSNIESHLIKEASPRRIEHGRACG